MTAKNSTHQFAFFYPDIDQKIVEIKRIIIDDKILCHRIVHVLRYDIGDMGILFNRSQHVQVVLEDITKKHLVFGIIQAYPNKIYQPYICLLLPILKREACEQAIYAAVELGANEIQLLITDKVQRAWGKLKEMERLEKIVIAAAEQSKNFVLPEIKEPVSLEYVLERKKNKQQIIFCDAAGQQSSDVINNLKKSGAQDIELIIGPEGDLTQAEKTLLLKHGAKYMALTPTTLRAQQAVTVGLGILRSMLHE